MDKIWYENFEFFLLFKLVIIYFYYNLNWKSMLFGLVREFFIDNWIRMFFLFLVRWKFWFEYEINGVWKLKLELIVYIGYFFVCYNICYVYDWGFWRIFISFVLWDFGFGVILYF